MELHVFGPVNKAVETAKLLGGLDSCTIWALIAGGLIAKEVWTTRKEIEIKKQEQETQKGWQDIRNRQIASETAQTEVMKHMTEEIVGMKMLITKYLIKE